MNSSKRITIILGFLIYISLFINIVNLYSNSPKVETFTNSKNQLERNPNSSGHWNLTGTPIVINGAETGVGAHNWTWFENQTWYGGGNGTLNNPYIIENITINGQGSGSCLQISNSSKYFIIRNCTLYNSGSILDTDGGIKLEQVTNGKLIDNNCSDNDANGIILSYSSNNNISGNIVNNNINHGIRMGEGCAENAILSNNANFNGNSGIYLYYINGIEIIDNFIDNNKNFGIYILGSERYASDYQVSGNNITNNNYGIYLIRGRYNNIYKNNASYNNRGLYSLDSYDNNINSNIIDYNKIGIYLENSNRTIISGNNINNNIQYGLNLVNSNYNEIYNNEVCDNWDYYNEDGCVGNRIENNKCIPDPPPPFPVIVIAVVISIVVTVVSYLWIFVYRKKIAREEVSKSIVSAQELEDLRRIEAEVSVEKEHHVCIVHRGKIVGAMYLCPNCETYYCLKCATVLKKKGETCWSCNNKIEL